MYPRLVIDLAKLRHNAEALCRMAGEQGVGEIGFVTKVFCADERMTRVLAGTPCRYLADSRLENLARCAGLGKERILLRLPMPSQAAEVVRSAEISLDSEPVTLRALSAAAREAGLVHKVVLMIDLGDLREGIFFREPEKILRTAVEIEADSHLELFGTAFNLTCYGSVLPTRENLEIFMDLTRQIEQRIGRELAFVSGGNSSSIPMLLAGELPEGVNGLRLGEVLVVGRETAYGGMVPGLCQDVVTLEAELLEVQDKPSAPVGEQGMNAFGERVHYVDRGVRRRAIAAVGRQDMDCEGLVPLQEGVSVVGASSDHLILDIQDCPIPLGVGDVLSFRMGYGGLLRGFTSAYVAREYRDGP